MLRCRAAQIIIDRVYSRGDNTFGIASVCVSVRLSVVGALSCLNRLTLIFGMSVDFDPMASLGL